MEIGSARRMCSSRKERLLAERPTTSFRKLALTLRDPNSSFWKLTRGAQRAWLLFILHGEPFGEWAGYVVDEETGTPYSQRGRAKIVHAKIDHLRVWEMEMLEQDMIQYDVRTGRGILYLRMEKFVELHRGLLPFRKRPVVQLQQGQILGAEASHVVSQSAVHAKEAKRKRLGSPEHRKQVAEKAHAIAKRMVGS